MSNEIVNKECWKRLNNITLKDWIRAAQSLGLSVIHGNGGKGSHYCQIRDPKLPDEAGPASLISTVTPNCFKEANQAVLKRFLSYGTKNGSGKVGADGVKNGFSEDDIWIALKLLKE